LIGRRPAGPHIARPAGRQREKPCDRVFLSSIGHRGGGSRRKPRCRRESPPIRDDCCGQIAAELRRLLGQRCRDDVTVVVKNRTFENWLIADLDAFDELRARFRLSNATRNAVAPDKADHAAALSLLKASVRSGSYDKVADSRRILGRAEARRIARNSRSFRRLLRVVDHPTYADQSARPA
jgi:hypothetical protein